MALILLGAVVVINKRSAKPATLTETVPISETDESPVKDTCCVAPPHQQQAPRWIGKGPRRKPYRLV